jgi:hypothetical protein
LTRNRESLLLCSVRRVTYFLIQRTGLGEVLILIIKGEIGGNGKKVQDNTRGFLKDLFFGILLLLGLNRFASGSPSAKETSC